MDSTTRSDSIRRRVALVATTVLVFGWVSAATAGAAPPSVSVATAAGIHLSLPAPTGHYPVGARSTFVADPSRSEPATGGVRTLPIRVWYPAAHRSHAAPARYLS